MHKLLACLLATSALAFVPACDGDDDDEVGENDRTDGVLEISGDAASGEMVFASVCGTAACHGADGNTPGTSETARLSDEVPELDDRTIVNVMLNGIEEMPSQAQLSDQELADTLAYLRQTFE